MNEKKANLGRPHSGLFGSLGSLAALLFLALELAVMGAAAQDFCPTRSLRYRNAGVDNGLERGLLAYFRTSDAASPLTDATGHGYNSISDHLFSYHASGGLIGGYVASAGTGNWIDLPNAILNDYDNGGTGTPTHPFSIQFWYNNDSLGLGAGAAFLGQWPASQNCPSGTAWVFWSGCATPSTCINFSCWDQCGVVHTRTDLQNSHVTFNQDNTWHQLVLVCDGTSIFLYVDTTVSSVSLTASGGIGDLYFSTDNISIGNYSSHSSGQPGFYAELGFWGRALSSTEVTKLYNNRAGLRPTGY